jgi:DNA-binding NtrC family response regulator
MQATLSSSAANISFGPPPGTPRFLVVDGSDPVRDACGSIASEMGFVVSEAPDATAARRAVSQSAPDLLLLDLEISGGGMALLAEMRRLYPAMRVAVMTEYATVATAVDCMRLGAGDYLPKPFTVEELAAVLARAGHRRDVDLESRILRDRLQTPAGMGEIIGRTPDMEKLFRILSKVAFTNHPVLILGESGTGKELIARSIHFNGSHPDRPFHLVDCTAVTPDALEAELFGRASTSNPSLDSPGLLSSPEGSTVFLDEVADLPPELQARLLRALQDKEVRPAGSVETRPLTARMLAATSRNLSLLAETGRFRKDLFYRLNVVALRIPPLRDRRDDIPALALHFLARLERETGATLSLSEETLRLMDAYDWPGNVRELETAMERACALTSGPVLHLSDLPTQLQEFCKQRAAEQAPPLPQPANLEPNSSSKDLGIAPGNVILSMAEIERQVILKTLRQLKGDKITAAKLLGIGKTTLYRKLKEYNIDDTEVSRRS